jgi:chemotaxis regulatin CheY-phosphate phosphatase CheZ
MSSLTTRPPEEELAYDQIEAAVKETSRGRWFLEEFSRRQRNSDTLAVLSAIEALQRSITLRSDTQPARPLVMPAGGVDAQDILELARVIAKAQAELRALRLDGEDAQTSASDELEAVVTTTESATSSILSAAERVQEQAWTMRENAIDIDACDTLDACATEIYTACTFQDLTAQRLRKMVDALHLIDKRLNSMLTTAGLSEQMHAERAALQPRALVKTGDDIWMSEAHQAEIDDTFEFFTPAAAAIEPTMVGADLMDFEEPPKSMDDILAEAQREPNLPRKTFSIELTPDAELEAELFEGAAIEAAMPNAGQAEATLSDAEPASDDTAARPFRMEIAGVGELDFKEPDHDALLDGIVAQPEKPASPFAEIDQAPLEQRIRAFR